MYVCMYVCMYVHINDKWFIWYGSQRLDWNNNQYNTIKLIQYCTRPRLIVISQAIGDKRILKFISSGCDQFKSLSMAQTVCHWQVLFFRQQIVQARRFAQHTAPEEPLSQLSTPWLGPVSTWMGDCLRAGKPSRYVTSHLGQLSLPSLQGRYIEYQPVWLGLRRASLLVSGGR